MGSDVYNYLLRKGLKPNLRGFTVIMDIISMVLQNEEDYYRSMSTKVFPEIMKKHNITKFNLSRLCYFVLKSSNIKDSLNSFVFKSVLDIKNGG